MFSFTQILISLHNQLNNLQWINNEDVLFFLCLNHLVLQKLIKDYSLLKYKAQVGTDSNISLLGFDLWNSENF